MTGPATSEIRNVVKVGGWYLRRDPWWNLTWAPLGMTVLIMRERTLRELWKRRGEIPGRIEWAKKEYVAMFTLLESRNREIADLNRALLQAMGQPTGPENGNWNTANSVGGTL